MFDVLLEPYARNRISNSESITNLTLTIYISPPNYGEELPTARPNYGEELPTTRITEENLRQHEFSSRITEKNSRIAEETTPNYEPTYRRK